MYRILYISLYVCALCGVVFLLPSCSGCSKSGRRHTLSQTREHDRDKERVEERRKRAAEKEERQEYVERSGGKTVVKMRKDRGGIYYISAELNGTPMEFFFDTGASLISISLTEFLFLAKQGKISKDDIIDESWFVNADGDRTKNYIINLRTVKIGNATLHNVKASVVPNQTAPLLLGQSALAKFGKISIDYKRREITFE